MASCVPLRAPGAFTATSVGVELVEEFLRGYLQRTLQPSDVIFSESEWAGEYHAELTFGVLEGLLTSAAACRGSSRESATAAAQAASASALHQLGRLFRMCVAKAKAAGVDLVPRRPPPPPDPSPPNSCSSQPAQEGPTRPEFKSPERPAVPDVKPPPPTPHSWPAKAPPCLAPPPPPPANPPSDPPTVPSSPANSPAMSNKAVPGQPQAGALTNTTFVSSPPSKSAPLPKLHATRSKVPAPPPPPPPSSHSLDTPAAPSNSALAPRSFKPPPALPTSQPCHPSPCSASTSTCTGSSSHPPLEKQMPMLPNTQPSPNTNNGQPPTQISPRERMGTDPPNNVLGIASGPALPARASSAINAQPTLDLPAACPAASSSAAVVAASPAPTLLQSQALAFPDRRSAFNTDLQKYLRRSIAPDDLKWQIEGRGSAPPTVVATLRLEFEPGLEWKGHPALDETAAKISAIFFAYEWLLRKMKDGPPFSAPTPKPTASGTLFPKEERNWRGLLLEFLQQRLKRNVSEDVLKILSTQWGSNSFTGQTILNFHGTRIEETTKSFPSRKAAVQDACRATYVRLLEMVRDGKMK